MGDYMGLDSIIKKMLSLQVDRKSLRNSASAVKINDDITAIHNAMGIKADDIASILKGRSNRADIALLESALVCMLPNDLALLEKLLNQMDSIDLLTKRVQRSVYLGMLHTAVFRKIQAVNNPRIQYEIDPNILLLANLSDCCGFFLQSIQAKIIHELKQANVFISFEVFCQNIQLDEVEQVDQEKKMAKLTVSYHQVLDEAIQHQALIHPRFNDLYQQHRAGYELQNMLFDTNHSPEERSVHFYDHLQNNLPTLKKGLDSAAIIFLKSVTVFLATVVTLPLFGIGGYLAFKGLFATPGKTLVAQAKEAKRIHESQIKHPGC
jgi:hypothetical protein